MNEKRKNQFVSIAVPSNPRQIAAAVPQGWNFELRRSLRGDDSLLEEIDRQVPLASGRGEKIAEWLKASLSAASDLVLNGSAMWKLIRSGDDNILPRLQEALAALNRNNTSFIVNHELDPYMSAASQTAEAGHFDVVIYGHTHLAKDVSFEVGSDAETRSCRYLNTGTWCLVMRLPKGISESESEAGSGDSSALGAFVEAMRGNNYDRYLESRPCYAELLIDGSGAMRPQAALHMFGSNNDPRRPVLEGSTCGECG